ncbi:hypothetical protein CO178_01135 [candidate division WWE3 bacterium CG_4_9_14_3_um_filter_34_6]|uniref:Uncharacterized protein n=1 Tax=candidate division WWE3 bacterium CG_4_9_14_3_um_filter_34_6 TaxID=1975079 RepID=A0A2M7X483_UNCKA|nr:MAG: hypothetical protein CO178_01135 [candidate division WWE3 bacterium CG_4_9_14_3_um_filter_34_6]
MCIPPSPESLEEETFEDPIQSTTNNNGDCRNGPSFEYNGHKAPRATGPVGQVRNLPWISSFTSFECQHPNYGNRPNGKIYFVRSQNPNGQIPSYS